ncbi:MAG: DUF4445 domain-containing protein [Deltaproteobacteria bacterium]|nr:DUF4445 domain-containing protein [Deltaproteobacteria bacterium]
MPYLVEVESGDEIRSCAAPAGITLLDALQQQDIPVNTACHGQGTCGKCLIKLKKGFLPITACDREHFSEAQLAMGYRLSCQARPKVSCSISVPTQFNLNRLPRLTWHASPSSYPSPRIIAAVDLGTTNVDIAFLDAETGTLIAQSNCLNRQIKRGYDVMTRLTYGIRGPKEAEDLQSLLVETLNRSWTTFLEEGKSHGIEDPTLERWIIAGNSCMTSCVWNEGLFELSQAPYRTTFSEMRTAPLPHDLLDKKCPPHPDPLPQGERGFIESPPIKEGDQGEMELKVSPLLVERDQSEMGLKVSPPLMGGDQGEGEWAATSPLVTTFPILGSFVGGDAAAAVLATGLDQAEKPTLLIDIGTNVELLLKYGEHLYVCSTPAGPAFEGGNISIGMRAEGGAITRIQRQNNSLACETIGGTYPKGICGSGLVQALAELVKEGWVKTDGEITSGQEEIGLTPKLSLTQGDIREFQLAKGALLTGITLLLEHVELRTTDLQQILLAGNFGEYLDLEAAMAIKMLPSLPLSQYKKCGNQSLEGAIALARNPDLTVRLEQIQTITSLVELALHDRFQEIFVKALTF